MMEKISQELLEEKLFGYVRKEKVMTCLDMFFRLNLRENEEISAKIVQKGLDNLVRQGRLMVLYPPNVIPNDALMSQTYYILNP